MTLCQDIITHNTEGASIFCQGKRCGVSFECPDFEGRGILQLALRVGLGHDGRSCQRRGTWALALSFCLLNFVTRLDAGLIKGSSNKLFLLHFVPGGSCRFGTAFYNLFRRRAALLPHPLLDDLASHWFTASRPAKHTSSKQTRVCVSCDSTASFMVGEPPASVPRTLAIRGFGKGSCVAGFVQASALTFISQTQAKQYSSTCLLPSFASFYETHVSDELAFPASVGHGRCFKKKKLCKVTFSYQKNASNTSPIARPVFRLSGLRARDLANNSTYSLKIIMLVLLAINPRTTRCYFDSVQLSSFMNDSRQESKNLPQA